jgi:hypothetical protein
MIHRYLCPDHVNPAEFLADLISIDYSSAEIVSSSQKRIDGLVESFSQQSSTILYATPIIKRGISKNSKKTIIKKKGGWWRQFWLLLKRAWMQVSLVTNIYVTHKNTRIYVVLLKRDTSTGEGNHKEIH